jgi:predicted HAD superfamily Cof-like phosphohydrolase
MYKELWLVQDFHEAFGVPVRTEPGFPSQERRDLRRRLEEEEWSELRQAERTEDLAAVADAIGDLIYVLLGHCLEYGIPIHQIFHEIHRSNMTKLGEDGKPVHRHDGKVIKGPNYQPPDITKFLYGRSHIANANT